MLQRIKPFRELVNEILDHLPINVWESNTTTFLDPAMGGGQFLVEVIRRLREYGHSDRNIRNRVFGFEYNQALVDLAINMNKLVGTFKKMSYWEFLEKDHKMKFDVVLGNPPYQTKNDDTHKKTTAIWHLFVEQSINDLVKDNGYVALIHPSGWRNLGGKFDCIRSTITSNNLLYLETHTVEDGKKTFGAGTRYDWYLLQKSPYNGKTTLKDDDGIIQEVNVQQMSFIPSSHVSEIMTLFGEPTVNFMYSRSMYGTDKHHMNNEKTKQFKYPCIQNVNIKDEPSCVWYSNIKQGHFSVPKVIFGRFGHGIIIDEKGTYGVCQDSYAITAPVADLPLIKKAMQSERFLELMRSTDVGGIGTIFNRRVISQFKQDFWKEFI